jgi:hypothetical protein
LLKARILSGAACWQDHPKMLWLQCFWMCNNLRNPPKTSRECVDTLAAQGLKAFSRMIGDSHNAPTRHKPKYSYVAQPIGVEKDAKANNWRKN